MPDSKGWPSRSVAPLRENPSRGPSPWMKREREDPTSVAWPRTLSEYGASWTSCFDGGLTTIASSTEFAVSLALSEPTSCDSEDSMDVRRSYAACGRCGFESFGRANKRVVKVLTYSGEISPETNILRKARRWMGVSGCPCACRAWCRPNR